MKIRNSKLLAPAGGSSYRTPLHEAVILKSLPICKLLMQHGADVTSFDIQRRSPLIDATDKSLKQILTKRTKQTLNNANLISAAFEATETRRNNGFIQSAMR